MDRLRTECCTMTRDLFNMAQIRVPSMLKNMRYSILSSLSLVLHLINSNLNNMSQFKQTSIFWYETATELYLVDQCTQ